MKLRNEFPLTHLYIYLKYIYIIHPNRDLYKYSTYTFKKYGIVIESKRNVESNKIQK